MLKRASGRCESSRARRARLVSAGPPGSHARGIFVGSISQSNRASVFARSLSAKRIEMPSMMRNVGLTAISSRRWFCWRVIMTRSPPDWPARSITPERPALSLLHDGIDHASCSKRPPRSYPSPTDPRQRAATTETIVYSTAVHASAAMLEFLGNSPCTLDEGDNYGSLYCAPIPRRYRVVSSMSTLARSKE